MKDGRIGNSHIQVPGHDGDRGFGGLCFTEEGIIQKDQRVVCILTGHILKDPKISTDYHTLTSEQLARKYKDYGV